jgi:hypothetical protein
LRQSQYCKPNDSQKSITRVFDDDAAIGNHTGIDCLDTQSAKPDVGVYLACFRQPGVIDNVGRQDSHHPACHLADVITGATSLAIRALRDACSGALQRVSLGQLNTIFSGL